MANEKRLTDVEVLQREKECVKRKTATNCTDCLNCDLLMTDERILSAYDNAIKALQAPTVDAVPVVHGRWVLQRYYGGMRKGMVMGMANYIELKTAIDFIKNNTPAIDGMTTLGCVERALYNTPNADVVEVVRCKDCEHWNYESGFCEVHSRVFDDGNAWDVFCETDFCSYVERREGE